MSDLCDGQIIDDKLQADSAIPAMHKIATYPIAKGHRILKYGNLIGMAFTNVKSGDHVHTHNCGMIASRT